MGRSGIIQGAQHSQSAPTSMRGRWECQSQRSEEANLPTLKMEKGPSSHGRQAASRSGKRRGDRSSHPTASQPCGRLDVSPVSLPPWASDPHSFRERTCVVFSH